MRVSINALRYFQAAAKAGSIVKAANELNVVPSAVSNAIEQVEQAFGLKLIQRYPAKGVAPTASGRSIMAKIDPVLEGYDTLFIEGSELRSALSGTLTIGYYVPVAPSFIPAITAPLLRDNPDVHLSLIECDNKRAQEGLISGEFDLIFFAPETVRNDIKHQVLINAPPYLLVSANHPLATRPSVTFSDFADEPMILLDLPFTGTYLREMFAQNDMSPNIKARASTTEMVRALVGAGVGVSVLNLRPKTNHSNAGDALVAVPIQTASPPIQLVLGHMGGNQRRLVTTFADAIRDYFKSEAAKDLIVTRR